jgi:hypothetical protein
VPLAMIRQLARYWMTDYDWRTCEASLNALPQFITEIDRVDIHFIGVDRTTSDLGELTRDEVLDITLYWLTNTGVSMSRLYWEYKGGFFNAKGVSIPVAVPRSGAEQAYPNLIYFNKADKGGHFAAWEQPQLFRGAPRAFRSPHEQRRSS